MVLVADAGVANSQLQPGSINELEVLASLTVLQFIPARLVPQSSLILNYVDNSSRETVLRKGYSKHFITNKIIKLVQKTVKSKGYEVLRLNWIPTLTNIADALS